MPSPPLGAPWDFRSVIDFLDCDSAEAASPEQLRRRHGGSNATHASTSSSSDNEDNGGVSLGAFHNVYETLGISSEPPPALGNSHAADPEDEINSDSTLIATPPPHVPPRNDAVNKSIATPESVAARDDTSQSPYDPFAALLEGKTKKQRYKLRKKAEKARKKEEDVVEQDDGNAQKQQQLLALLAQSPETPSQQKPRSVEVKAEEARSHSNIGVKVTAATPVRSITSSQPEDRVLVSDPRQLLIKAQKKEKKASATVAVTPPVANNITPSLALYTQRSGLSSCDASPLKSKSMDHLPNPTHHAAPVEAQKSVTDQGGYRSSPADLPLVRGPADVQHNASIPRLSGAGDTPIRGLHDAGTANPVGFSPYGLSPAFQQSAVVQKLYSTAGIPFHPSLRQNALPQGQYAPFGTPVGAAYPPVYQMQPPPSFGNPQNQQNQNANPYNSNLTPQGYGLVPSTIRAPPPSNKKLKKMADTSREDRNWEFQKKLIERFPEEKKYLVDPMRLLSDKKSSEGIHVFVDASNIQIGFKDALKRNGGKMCDLSIDSLFLLLERRRPVAKRFYAGSIRSTASDSPHYVSNVKHKEVAEAVGYELSIYEQVYKTKELTDSQRFMRDADRMGWVKAKANQEARNANNNGSDPEIGTPGVGRPQSPPPAPKWVEQGVDEIIHLRMCQSILDSDVPSTMVLATGDGAQAEYSDGFLGHVERALKNGWNVELVSWKQQLSGGYKNRNFRQKWGDRFRIIELEDYLEFMMDV